MPFNSRLRDSNPLSFMPACLSAFSLTMFSPAAALDPRRAAVFTLSPIAAIQTYAREMISLIFLVRKFAARRNYYNQRDDRISERWNPAAKDELMHTRR